jgi:multiple sugar transport system ATP-binding protein
MRSRIKVLQREMGITTLYVTHDQEEAMTLGDKLIIMDDGRIQQIGSPDEVYHEPQNRFVAGFIGSPSMNFVDVALDDGVATDATGRADFAVELDPAVAERYDGYDRFELGVRPGYFEAHAEPVGNAISGTVKVTEPLGDEQIIDVVVDGSSELELTVTAPTTVDVDRNDAIWLTLRDDLVHGFDPDTGRRIAPADMQRRAAVESNRSEAAD